MSVRQKLKWASVLVCSMTIMLWGIASLIAPADAGQKETVSPQEAKLELLVPPGTRVSIDGESKGTKRSFTYHFNGFPRGQVYPYEVTAQFPNGRTVRRRVFLRGGWHVRLPLQDSIESKPELVLQTGHTQAITSATFSPDGRWILTGSADHTAILWDTEYGRKLRTYAGHASNLIYANFGANGKEIYTLGADKIIVWDRQTGKQLKALRDSWENMAKYFPQSSVHAFSPDRKLCFTTRNLRRRTTISGIIVGYPPNPDITAEVWELHERGAMVVHSFFGHSEGHATAMALNRDGTKLITGSKDKTLILWDARTYKEIQTLKGHKDAIAAVSFTVDGKRILSLSKDKTVILWDVGTGEQLWTKDSIANAVFTADGKRILSISGEGKTTILWDVKTGERLWTFESADNVLVQTFISADGKRAALACAGGGVIVVDMHNGKRLFLLQSESQPILTVAFDSQRQRILSGTGAGLVLSWDINRSQKPDFLDTHPANSWTWAVDFSPNHQQVLIGSKGNSAMLWDVVNHKKLATLSGHKDRVRTVAFSPDGRRAVTGSRDKTAILWDLQTHKSLATLHGHENYVRAVAFSPNDQRILTGSADGTPSIQFWNARTGQKLALNGIDIDSRFGGLETAIFAPDNDRFLIGTKNGSILLVNTKDSKTKHTFRGHSNFIHSLAFSSDKRYLLSGSCDRTAVLWDFKEGKQLRTFTHTHCVHSAVFGPEDRTVITGSIDGAIHLWDVATGDELARLIGLGNSQDWLVVTPEGLFDGSEGGRLKVSYRVGQGFNVVPLDYFSKDFYSPGLLMSLMQGERPMPEVELGKKRAPKLRIVSPQQGGIVESSQVTLEIEAIDEGGGVQGPWLYHQGARVLTNEPVRKAGRHIRRRFTANLVQGDNRFEVKAASGDGSWQSDPETLTLTYLKSLPKPELYLLAVGINHYADKTLNLKFARSDAEKLADLFVRRGKSLYREVHCALLADDKATHFAIQQELKKIAAKARSQDTLLVFLSGHGTTIGQRYYFIPHEFQCGKNRLEDVIRKQGLADDVLSVYLTKVPALKRILILDTCASGAVIGRMERKRNPFAFRRVIDSLNHSQGIYTLAAAASSEEAGEVKELGHGVLSYALLAGLHAVKDGLLKDQSIHPSNADQVASVLGWFDFASQQVPYLTEHYFGRKQDVQIGNRGNNFPILPVEDRPE